MTGATISVPARDGGSFKCYLATPEQGSGPGIVLLQEIFGINQYIRDVADDYADEGYVVLAPDLFWRLEPDVELDESDFEKAFALYQKFDVPKAVEDIVATVAALRAQPACKGKIGAASSPISRLPRPGSIARSAITGSPSSSSSTSCPRSNARWCCNSPPRTS